MTGHTSLVRLGASALCLMAAGCGRPATSTPTSTPTSAVAREFSNRFRGADGAWLKAANVRLNQWRHVPDLAIDLAQFETVFWDAADTDSLRQWIRQRDLAGHRVMEIGTGTGLVSLCCLQAGAERVVATDINPNALANLFYNVKRMEWLNADALDIRWVSKDKPGAYSVLRPPEKFDLIVSNPPWENGKPTKLEEFAFYDEEFQLLESLLSGLEDRLTPGGTCLLAYGCREAIHTVLARAEHYGLEAKVLDDRSLEDLPEVFVPGMLIEVKPATDSANKLKGGKPYSTDRPGGDGAQASSTENGRVSGNP